MPKTSKEMRSDILFMRNTFEARGKWGIPLVKKQRLVTNVVSLIAYSDTRANDSALRKQSGVHFFIDDYRFNKVYANPKQSLPRLSQYSFILTPDYSTYADMPPWRQIESVAHSRWCGAYWQNAGMAVFPTISWSGAESFGYCFDGVEEGSVVAVGTVGCRRNKLGFMRGYDAMLEKLRPSAIICYGEPYSEMRGNIIAVEYVRWRQSRGRPCQSFPSIHGARGGDGLGRGALGL